MHGIRRTDWQVPDGAVMPPRREANMATSDNTRGAVLMMAAMAAFTMNDTCLKLLSDEMGLSQALFLRGLGTVAVFAAFARLTGVLQWNLPRRDWALIAIRSAGEVAAAYFFLIALFNMPIANVTAIFQALPLAITLAGAIFLRDPVGWRRMAAILIGFLGVILIVRPGTDGFNIYAIYALAAVVSVVIRDLATRQLSRDVPSAMVSLWAGVAVTLCSGVVAATEPWVVPSAAGAAQLLGSLIFVVAGYQFGVMAMRVGDLGFVAPFRYTGLLFALVLGFVVFAEWPDTLTLTGSAIIVATGLFTLYRERRV